MSRTDQNESTKEMPERLETMAADDGETWDLSVNDQAAIAWAVKALRRQPIETAPTGCTCEIDRHDFNCPVHNDSGPSRRGPNGDE